MNKHTHDLGITPTYKNNNDSETVDLRWLIIKKSNIK